MGSPHVTSDFEALKRRIAPVLTEVAKPRPAEMAGESGWSPVRSQYGAWAVIGTHEAGGFVYNRVNFVGNVERREANQSDGQHDEDVIMTDAPPTESADGGIVFASRFKELPIDYSDGMDKITCGVAQLSIAPHQTFSHQNTQVGETSEDVEMTNSNW
ncbi:hypothetical protein Landi51_01169 [Colletotrichum acutatum]